jgi:hypothetical protein
MRVPPGILSSVRRVDVVGEVVHVVVAGEQDRLIWILCFEVDDVVEVGDLIACGDIEGVEVIAEKDKKICVFFEAYDLLPVGPAMYVADYCCFHVLWLGF